MKEGSKKKGTADSVRPSALLRVAVGEDGSLTADAMPEFREWLVAHVPALAASAAAVPDDGGLNVEGLAWDPAGQALLFGVRTPVVDGMPIVVPVSRSSTAIRSIAFADHPSVPTVRRFSVRSTTVTVHLVSRNSRAA